MVACRLIACLLKLWKLISQHQYHHILRCSYALLAFCTLLLQATASQVDRGGSNVKLHVTESIVEAARDFESNENSFSSSFGNWILIFLVTNAFHSLVAIAFDSYVMVPKRRHDTQSRFSLIECNEFEAVCFLRAYID